MTARPTRRGGKFPPSSIWRNQLRVVGCTSSAGRTPDRLCFWPTSGGGGPRAQPRLSDSLPGFHCPLLNEAAVYPAGVFMGSNGAIAGRVGCVTWLAAGRERGMDDPGVPVKLTKGSTTQAYGPRVCVTPCGSTGDPPRCSPRICSGKRMLRGRPNAPKSRDAASHRGGAVTGSRNATQSTTGATTGFLERSQSPGTVWLDRRMPDESPTPGGDRVRSATACNIGRQTTEGRGSPRLLRRAAQRPRLAAELHITGGDGELKADMTPCGRLWLDWAKLGIAPAMGTPRRGSDKSWRGQEQWASRWLAETICLLWRFGRSLH